MPCGPANLFVSFSPQVKGGVGVSFLIDIHSELAWDESIFEGIVLHISDELNLGEIREILIEPGSRARILLTDTYHKLEVLFSVVFHTNVSSNICFEYHSLHA